MSRSRLSVFIGFALVFALSSITGCPPPPECELDVRGCPTSSVAVGDSVQPSVSYSGCTSFTTIIQGGEALVMDGNSSSPTVTPTSPGIVDFVISASDEPGARASWSCSFDVHDGDGGCGGDADCDDADACTDEACVDGSCQYSQRDCDDGEFCNGAEACDPTTGACESSGNPCNSHEICNVVTDTCDPLSLCTDYADGDNGVVITCQLELNEPLQISTSGAYPDWSPDGSGIVFNDSGIHVYNPCEGTRQMVRNTGLTPTWSPSGEKIAFYEDGGLYLMNPDGGDPERIGDGGVEPQWSPDGTKILSADGNYSPPRYLRLTNLCTEEQAQLYFANLGDRVGQFTWAPTGAIAVSIPRSNNADGDWLVNMLKVFDLDGMLVDTITLEAYQKKPFDIRFSPDGDKLAHAVGSRGVWVANADGSADAQISDRGGALAWSPDGRYLVIDDSSSNASTAPDYGIWIIPVRARTVLPPCNETNPTAEELRQAVFSNIGVAEDAWGDSSDFQLLINAVEDEIGCSLSSGDGAQAQQRSQQEVRAEECAGVGIRPRYCGPGFGSGVDGPNPLVPSCMNKACCEHDMCYADCDVGSDGCYWSDQTEECDASATLVAICSGEDSSCNIDEGGSLLGGQVICALVDCMYSPSILDPSCLGWRAGRILLCSGPLDNCGECVTDDDCDVGETCEEWTCMDEPVCDNDGLCETGENTSNCPGDCPVSGGACDDAPSLQFSGGVAVVTGTLAPSQEFYSYQFAASEGEHVEIVVDVPEGDELWTGLRLIYPPGGAVTEQETSGEVIELDIIVTEEAGPWGPPGTYCIAVRYAGNATVPYTLTVTVVSEPVVCAELECAVGQVPVDDACANFNGGGICSDCTYVRNVGIGPESTDCLELFGTGYFSVGVFVDWDGTGVRLCATKSPLELGVSYVANSFLQEIGFDVPLCPGNSEDHGFFGAGPDGSILVKLCVERLLVDPGGAQEFLTDVSIGDSCPDNTFEATGDAVEVQSGCIVHCSQRRTTP